MARLDDVSVRGGGAPGLASAWRHALLAFLLFVLLTGLWAYLWVH